MYFPETNILLLAGKQLDVERFDRVSTSVIKAKRLLNVMLVCMIVIYGIGVQHRALGEMGRRKQQKHA